MCDKKNFNSINSFIRPTWSFKNHNSIKVAQSGIIVFNKHTEESRDTGRDRDGCWDRDTDQCHE